jgi:hypothetical protein
MVVVHNASSSNQSIDQHENRLFNISSSADLLEPLLPYGFQAGPSADDVATTQDIVPVSTSSSLPPTLAPDELLDNWLQKGIIEERLVSEQIDLAWAPPMEARIMNEIATVDLRFIAVQAHCRSTMCRVEALIDDRAGNLQPGMTGDALMPAVRTAIRSTRERWFIPVIASWTMRLDGGMLSDGAGTPPRTRAWLAYVYDARLLPSIAAPTARNDLVSDLSIQGMRQHLMESEEGVVGSDGWNRVYKDVTGP